MFSPSREQVRELFFGAWDKYRAGTPLAGMDAVALDIILAHPEYHALLSDPDRHRDKDYGGEANPFLHMSLHLALEEQLSIDQPPTISSVFEEMVRNKGDRHAALHEAIECLAEMLWRSQRYGTPPDPAAYLDCLTRSARR
ncbi:MAG TPA: DUF1841 family protein [Burkholderiales bacterium]|nr:DUF1841 family protein [Burkholderiales bacterium]